MAEAKLRVGQIEEKIFLIFLFRYVPDIHNDLSFCLLALLKRQGLNVKGLMKAAPVKEEPQPYIDCTGNLQVLLSLSTMH